MHCGQNYPQVNNIAAKAANTERSTKTATINTRKKRTIKNRTLQEKSHKTKEKKKERKIERENIKKNTANIVSQE